MTTNFTRGWFWIGVVLVLVPARAFAFLGIGDISYDPANHAELVAMFSEMKDYYNTAIQQLDRLDSVQNTLTNAYASYNRIKNLDLHTIAEGLSPGIYLRTDPDKIAALRDELMREAGNSDADKGYVESQIQNIADLQSLAGLEAAGNANVQAASSDLSEKDAAQVTAQSTATLAALSAAEAQRRKQHDMAAAQATRQQQGGLDAAANLYGAMGDSTPTPGSGP